MPDQPNHEREIFETALELNSAEARSAYLRDQCVDAGLRARVETLLRAHERAGGFLPAEDVEPQAVSSANTLTGSGAVAVTEKPGDRIGRYKLREKIGEGGCGVVYVAEQEEPVRRRVALKVIKLGMDTRSVIARFGAERQALAMMDHPNIAKVFDAGATDTGRPYFVMELVRGIKLTDYCDQYNLPTRERLDLFIKVCQAIQHAHQKGIIHRDLKPSNILVTLHDGVPVPKIIDFGIAKATEGRLTDLTVYTELHQFLGTPAYMSPEQAEMSGLDIDTRSDIYSLGVLLYELLTGATPFDAKDLLRSGLDAMRKTIRETEPLRPSTRLSTMLHADLTSLARRHRAEAPKLVHLIRGDLDWIVMKSLEKDRARRYDTANGLAMDIQRHLSNEPIIARPPSNLYRFQKTVRRNRLAFAAATAVVVALALGMCLAAWSLLRERVARTHAEAAQSAAHTEAAKQEAVNNFLNEMFASADPGALSVQDQTKGRTVTVVQVLDVAVKQLEAGSLKGRPEIEAAVRQTLGKTYQSLGQFAAADAQLRRALELNRKVDGPESSTTARTMNALSRLCLSQDKLGEAEQLQREELALQKKLHGGKEDPEVARALYDLAVIHMEEFLGDPGQLNQEKAADSETAFREALAMQRRLLPPKHGDLAKTLSVLARLLMLRGTLEESERLFDEALLMQKDLLGPEHPEVASTMQQISGVYMRAHKKRAEAEDLCHQAIAIQRRVLGNDHPALASSLLTLGETLGEQNKHAESEAAFREALAIRRKALGENNIHVAWCLKRLAECLVAQQKLAEGEQVYREALQVWGRCRGVEAGGYTETVHALVGVLKSQGKQSETDALFKQVLAQERASLGEHHPAVVATLCDLAGYLQSQGKMAEAEKVFREALDIPLKLPVKDQDRLPSVIQGLAGALNSQGKSVDAKRLYETWIEAARHRLGETNPILGQLLYDFGGFLRDGQQNFPAAAEQFAKALRIRRATPNDDLAPTLRELGHMLLDSGLPEEAEGYLRESLALYRKLHQAEDFWGTAMTASWLADALYQQDRLPEAEHTYREALLGFSKTKGAGDPDYARALRALVGILKTEGKAAEIEPFLKDALVQQRKVLGEQRVPLVMTLFSLADLFKSQNKPDEAMKCYGEASDLIANFNAGDLHDVPASLLPQLLEAGLQHQLIDACFKVLELKPTEAARVADICWGLITALKTTGPEAALLVELSERAVAGEGRTNSYTLDGLAMAVAWAGDFTNAVRVQQEAIALLRDEGQRKSFLGRLKHYESNTPFQETWLQARFALARLTEGNPAEAELIARESLALNEKLAIGEWSELDSRGLVGVILLQRKKYAEAESLLLSAYDGLKRREDSIPANYRHLLNKPIRHLARLYEATGKPEKAKEWRAKLPTLATGLK